MKIKIVLMFALLATELSTFSQTSKATLYKSGQWADIKGKGDFAIAMDNPIYEKVEILKTNTNIKVTFGSKVYNYTIVSSKQFSTVKTDYTVTLNGKTYLLYIGKMMDGTYDIGIDGLWMVPDIKDIKTVDVY